MRTREQTAKGPRPLAIAIAVVLSMIAAPASAQAAEPDTQIDSGPANGSATTSSTVSFTYSSSSPDIAGFECSINGARFQGCPATGATYTLTPSLHTFDVRAINNAGEVDSSPAARRWVISQAGDTFVSQAAGSDGNSCTDLVTPCKTIAGGIAKAAPGRAIYVAPGSYGESVDLGGLKSLRAILGPASTSVRVVRVMPAAATSGQVLVTDLKFLGGTSATPDANVPLQILGPGGSRSLVATKNQFDTTGLIPAVAPPADALIGSAPGTGRITIHGNSFRDDFVGSPTAIRAQQFAGGGTIVISSNNIENFARAVDLTASAQTTVAGNNIVGNFQPTVPPPVRSISISSAASGTGVTANIRQNYIRTPHSSDSIGIEARRAAGDPPLSIFLRRNRIGEGYATGIRAEHTTTATLSSDVVMGTAVAGLSAVGEDNESSVGNVAITNATFRDNGTDLTGSENNFALNSTIVEDAIAMAGGGGAQDAGCSIAYSRGPISSPPNGCGSFTTQANPGFAAAGDFHLSATSPLIDTGDPAAPDANNLLDFDGNPRAMTPVCGQPAVRDIGAHEVAPPNCPPETNLDAPLPTDPSGTSVTFHYSSPDSDVVSFECKLDGVVKPCGGDFANHGEVTLSGLAGGVQHTFTVAAMDGGALKDASPASFTWLTDPQFDPGVAPETRLDDPLPSNPSDGQVTFRYSSPDRDAVGYACALDGAPVGCGGGTPAGGQVTLSDLAGGQHTFTVAAFDGDNPRNQDQTPATYTWSVAGGGSGSGRKSPGLRIVRMKLKGRKLVVKGRADGAATGRVQLFFKTKGVGRVRKRGSGVLDRGSFRVKLRLRRPVPRAARGKLRASYAGDARFTPEVVSRKVRRKK